MRCALLSMLFLVLASGPEPVTAGPQGPISNPLPDISISRP